MQFGSLGLDWHIGPGYLGINSAHARTNDGGDGSRDERVPALRWRPGSAPSPGSRRRSAGDGSGGASARGGATPRIAEEEEAVGDDDFVVAALDAFS